MGDTVKIAWYGRCCFLVDLNNTNILFDPYDKFCNVDIGLIDAQVLVSSSTWHDHGHIGASPGAWVFTYPGYYKHLGIEINGLEIKEERGTPTVVFNIRYKNVSITNFADMGIYIDSVFDNKQKEILRGTEIAFIRSGHEKVLNFCNPKVIIPEHFFPIVFINDQVAESLRKDFEIPNTYVDKMVDQLGMPLEEYDGYECNVDISKVNRSKIVRFMKIHPQVKYSEWPTFKRYW